MKISPRLSRHHAFTLLELLVVISIIAVLAGILLPVGQGVLERAKKVDAKVTMNSIVTAVKSYQTEYGQYPVEQANANGAAATAVDTTFDTGDSGAAGSAKGGRNGILMDVLRAVNNIASSTGSVSYKALNSRQIPYFEYKDVKNVADPRSGFIPKTAPAGVTIKTGYSAGDLVDPWGNLFCVRIDTSYSDTVVNPYPVSGTATAPSYKNDASDESDPNKLLRTAVVAWTPGKDATFGGNANGDLTTNCDDVASWQ